MIAGVLAGARFRSPTGKGKPIIGLLSFAVAIALLFILELLPQTFEMPIFLLIGIAIGFGVKLISEKDGYLVRDDGPPEELD